MTEAWKQDHLEPLSSGQRRPPRPPIRIAEAMEDGLADDDGASKGGRWRVSPEKLKQIEKAITWPTVKALSKITAALRLPPPGRRSHFDEEVPPGE